MIEIIEKAAKLIEHNAEALMDSCCLDGKWDHPDDETLYLEELETARQLRASSLAFGALMESIEVLEDHLPDVPDPNCSCHLSPPCGDCVNWSSLREALETIHGVRKQAKQERSAA